MSDVQGVVFEAINDLLGRREGAPIEVSLDSDLLGDLQLDSLERAELSSMLEDRLGSDPYNEGFEPVTVRELIAYYGL